MKKYILYVVQHYLHCRPSLRMASICNQPAATGFSKTVVHNFGGQPDYKSVTGTDFSVVVGYRINKWRFATGMSYLQTGCKQELTIATFDPLTGTTGNIQNIELNIYFHHLVVPLTAAYNFRLSDKLALIPAIGAELSYNASGKVTETGEPDKVILSASHNDTYQRISFGVLPTSMLNIQLANDFLFSLAPLPM